jgi:cytosine deaminase
MRSLVNTRNIPWVCHHLHLDKSKTINPHLLDLSQRHMKEKWFLMKEIKENYTKNDLYVRMFSTVTSLYNQNCRRMRTFIDIDSTIGLRGIEVALEVKDYWVDHGVHIQIGTQPLEGLSTPENIDLFEKAASMVDFIGCLPSRDKSPEEHLDIVFSTAQKDNKPVEAHLDQCNIPSEKETELFCDYVEKYKYEGNARGIHCVSLACQPLEYQNEIAARMNALKIGAIICPSAAISMTQHSEYMAPIHNSIGPVGVFLNNDVKVGLGIDNIEDIFMPFCDGDLEFELRLLAEAARIYDPEILKEIATNIMGFEWTKHYDAILR